MSQNIYLHDADINFANKYPAETHISSKISCSAYFIINQTFSNSNMNIIQLSIDFQIFLSPLRNTSWLIFIINSSSVVSWELAIMGVVNVFNSWSEYFWVIESVEFIPSQILVDFWLRPVISWKSGKFACLVR